MPTKAFPLLEIQVFVPLHDHTGRPFSDAHHEAFEDSLAREFGGYTEIAHDLRGGWLSQGRVVRDRLRVYAIGAPTKDASRLAHRVQRIVARHYVQDAVFVRTTSATADIG